MTTLSLKDLADLSLDIDILGFEEALNRKDESYRIFGDTRFVELYNRYLQARNTLAAEINAELALAEEEVLQFEDDFRATAKQTMVDAGEAETVDEIDDDEIDIDYDDLDIDYEDVDVLLNPVEIEAV
jgi:hypothetical protein